MMDDEYADRVLALLVGTANALKGAPTAPTFYHDWSDLPAVAAALVFERDRLREVVDVAVKFVIAFDTEMDYEPEIDALRLALMALLARDGSAEVSDG